MISIRLKFNEIKRDAYGRIETPVLMLQRPHGAILGALGDFCDLQMELKFNEPSKMTFKYPKRNHGKRTKFYDNLVGDKLIQVDPYGVFVVTDAKEIMEDDVKYKEIECTSREYELSSKRVFFADGTYNLWNPADVENTMLGMIFKGLNWKVGKVSASLIGKYRTFPETESMVHDFLIGEIQEKYGCVCDFDTYNRVVDVVDINEAVATMPVFLSRKNLLKSADLTENTDSLKTKILVQGAEGVDIRNVNPTGDSWIYNLDYYISNGDLPADLAAKWRTWENAIFTQQSYYTSVVALRNAANSRRLSLEAELTDLQNNLKTLDNTRATFLQMLKTPYSEQSMAYLEANGISIDNVYEYFNGRLADTAVEYKEIEAEVAALETKIKAVAAERDEHEAALAGINDELKISNYFTADELTILNCYFKEDTFSDNTFAVFDVDVSSSGTYNKLTSAPLVFTDVKWTEVNCEGGHRIAAITGGHVSISEGDVVIEANIIRGTIDHIDGEVVCSLHLGSGSDCGTSFSSGNLTYSAVSSYDDDSVLASMTKHEDTIYSADKSVSHTMYYYTGDATIPGSDIKVYFTRNVTDYQRYSVEQDLYDYAQECMNEIAWPGYEFDIESGNFVFAQKFEPFKRFIQLGCNVHLEIDDDLFLKPMLIEIHLNFDEPDDFTLVFSNFFQRPDAANGLKELIDKAASTSTSIDMSKYEFGQNANTTTWVKDMIERGFDAAMVQINGGKDQMVSITEAGISVDSENGTSKIYLNNGMIALVDKTTNTVKMAMGQFLNEASGTDFVGVLADVIGGTLIAGQNLIIECPDPNGGVMQFKVDSSGVIINNGRMYMRTDKGAMGWDANYGFFAGVKDLFETTDTGHVYPTCINPETGELILDDDGFPEGVNVWIGIDGKAYFRGNVYAENGYFSGEVHATSGTFKGVIQASTFLDSAGNNMMENGKWKSNYVQVPEFTIEASNGTSSSTVSIYSDGVFVDSAKIQFTGDVVFASDLEDGTTTISGDCITTGTVYVDNLCLYGEMDIYESDAAGAAVGGTFGYYQGWSYTNGVFTETSGVGIRDSSSTGQLNCSDHGAWCGFGSDSGFSAYSAGVTIKGDYITFSGTTADFSNITKFIGLPSGGTTTAVFG